MRIQRGMKGFTLIELAIVLVIIGLIIGAILKGGELITSAKYKRLKMDWDAVMTAIYTYQDKFNALPGDDANATTNLTAVYPEPTPTNGGGNVTIGTSILVCDGTLNTDTEQCQAWYHMRLAGLLPGARTKATKHSFGGWMAIGGTSGTFTSPAWSNPWAVCHQYLQNKVAKWLDDHYDDGGWNSGSIRGDADYSGSGVDGEATASTWVCIKGT